jgi:uncharacterized phage-associated protein
LAIEQESAHMSVLIAARTLGDISGWKLTNLEMQKVLYVAQMLHLGRTGEPLFREHFEAWEYGPVVPRLYRYNKGHGRKPIPEVRADSFAMGTPQSLAIADALAMVGHMTPGQLIEYTHRQGGAWEQHFKAGESSEIIPNSAILEEFQKHMRPSDDAIAWAEQVADQVAARPSRYLDSANERAFRTRVFEARLH